MGNLVVLKAVPGVAVATTTRLRVHSNAERGFRLVLARSGQDVPRRRQPDVQVRVRVDGRDREPRDVRLVGETSTVVLDWPDPVTRAGALSLEFQFSTRADFTTAPGTYESRFTFLLEPRADAAPRIVRPDPQPSPRPTRDPVVEPTATATASALPTPQPSAPPTPEPSASAAVLPSPLPSASPTSQPPSTPTVLPSPTAPVP